VLPLLPASTNCAKLLRQNSCGEPNQHVLTSLHPIFNWHGLTIPSTSRDVNHIYFSKMLKFSPEKIKDKNIFQGKIMNLQEYFIS
jgi:hypothetical protein